MADNKDKCTTSDSVGTDGGISRPNGSAMNVYATDTSSDPCVDFNRMQVIPLWFTVVGGLNQFGYLAMTTSELGLLHSLFGFEALVLSGSVGGCWMRCGKCGGCSNSHHLRAAVGIATPELLSH